MKPAENTTVPPTTADEWEAHILSEIERLYGDSLNTISTNGLASLEHGHEE